MTQRTSTGRFAKGHRLSKGRPKGSKNRRMRERLAAPLPALPALPADASGKDKTELFIEMAQTFAPEALQHIVDVMRRDRGATGLAAAKAIIERAHGRPMEAGEIASRMTMDMHGGGTIEIVFVRAEPKMIEGRVISDEPSGQVH
jgi:hypothetical protein